MSNINTIEQTIDDLFSAKTYHIDFYQRDYKWGQEHIDRLLEDILYRFNLEYREERDPGPTTATEYGWYYLNAYVTNSHAGDTYIVDGQQRLTTLTLMLVVLYHSAMSWKSDCLDWLKSKIVGFGARGKSFWMGCDSRAPVLEDLYEKGSSVVCPDHVDEMSLKRMYDNYHIISRELNSNLSTKHKFESFVYYLLLRVLLVKIHISDSNDVPMVFEVINDRGERLRPYEVLKGKLLGQIDKAEIHDYADMWDTGIHAIQAFGEAEVDAFFRSYFRGRFIGNASEYSEFDGDYHKIIFAPKWNNLIGFKKNVKRVKEFLRQDFPYYSNLYATMMKDASAPDSACYPNLAYNHLNEQDRQYLLVFSACLPNDPLTHEKVKAVTYMYDRMFTSLNLMGAYDSRRLTDSIVQIARDIRDKSSKEIVEAFDNTLKHDLSDAKGSEVGEAFEWSYFRNAGNHSLGKRFLRYFFARIEHFIAVNSGKPIDSWYNLVRSGGYVYGYHVEHIIARNDENLSLFVDENEFNEQRNRLGALLLLKGKDNTSSGKEGFQQKLRTYSGTNLWNQTLLGDFYHSNPVFRDFTRKYGLKFKPYSVFDAQSVEERQCLLFEMAKIIWSTDAIGLSK